MATTLLADKLATWQMERMNSPKMKSLEQVNVWLSGKPFDWKKMIYTRSALRVLPTTARTNENWLKFYAISLFQANLIAWMSLDASNLKFHAPAELVRNALQQALRRAYDDVFATPAIFGAMSAVLSITGESAEHLFVWEEKPERRSRYYEGILVDLLVQVEKDCDWLILQENASIADLTGISLWMNQHPEIRWQEWQLLKEKLLAADPNYSVWIDWYERRIRGERAAFDIPGDKGRIEDKKILRRLAEATDEDFWGKGHEYVNAALKGWLDEARERVAPPAVVEERAGVSFGSSVATAVPIAVAPLGTIKPQFGLDGGGRIAINGDAGADQLRSDPQALSRHARALEMAQRLGDALRNHNSAGYITEMASDYLAAMNGPDPSGLVFAGDQLRLAIANHRAADPDDDLQPLPPSADRDASAFLSAHNMYVGSDPFLDDLDRTTRGPDAPLPSANPDEIRLVANTARDDDILAEQTYDYMIAASDAAPATYDSADRHSRFAAGLAQNFARYGIELLWSYPNEAAWAGLTAGAVVTVALGPLAAAGGTIAGIGIAYHMARNMIANEAIYEKLLATSPAGEDNFNRLMRFLKSMPIKSLKDD
jgi:hypothetical protein